MNPPTRPDESDCCNSGCNPCIFDVYEQQLKLFEKYKTNQSTENEKNYDNCLNQSTYSYFKLIKSQNQTPNILFFTFEYAQADSNIKLTYDVTQHFLLKNSKVVTELGAWKDLPNDEQFTRAYTPIPRESISKLTFTILVKLYPKGKMSNFIRNLAIGDITKWRGPYGNFKVNFNFKNILCVTQGVGLAPIYGVIKNILDNEQCETRLHLMACFKNVEEFSLRKELNEFQAFWNFTMKIFLAHETDNEFWYNEKIECRRLVQSDFEDYFNSTMVDRNKTQVLICGNDLFNSEIRKIMEKYCVEIHVF